MKKRIISFLLVMALVLSMAPAIELQVGAETIDNLNELELLGMGFNLLGESNLSNLNLARQIFISTENLKATKTEGSDTTTNFTYISDMYTYLENMKDSWSVSANVNARFKLMALDIKAKYGMETTSSSFGSEHTEFSIIQVYAPREKYELWLDNDLQIAELWKQDENGNFETLDPWFVDALLTQTDIGTFFALYGTHIVTRYNAGGEAYASYQGSKMATNVSGSESWNVNGSVEGNTSVALQAKVEFDKAVENSTTETTENAVRQTQSRVTGGDGAAINLDTLLQGDNAEVNKWLASLQKDNKLEILNDNNLKLLPIWELIVDPQYASRRTELEDYFNNHVNEDYAAFYNDYIYNADRNTDYTGYTFVSTPEAFYDIRNDLAGKYVLLCDIDLSAYSEWEPIGQSKDDAFTGILDGNGNTVRGLNVTMCTNGAAGLFGYNAGIIRNLQVEGDVNIEAAEGNHNIAYVGGIVGYNMGRLEMCRNGVTVDSNMDVFSEGSQQTSNPENCWEYDESVVTDTEWIEGENLFTLSGYTGALNINLNGKKAVKLVGTASEGTSIKLTSTVPMDDASMAYIVLENAYFTGFGNSTAISSNCDRTICIISTGEGNAIVGGNGGDGATAISAEKAAVYVVGEAPLTLKGGEPAFAEGTYSDGTGKHAQNGADGVTAVVAKSFGIDMKNNAKVMLVGSNGVKGATGTRGADGNTCTVTVNGNSYEWPGNAQLDGQQGGQGGNGGQGGYAIQTDEIKVYSGILHMLSGNGGQGGNGGRGGNGTNGLDIQQLIDKGCGTGVVTVLPQRGGHGGQGGTGGDGGHAPFPLCNMEKESMGLDKAYCVGQGCIIIEYGQTGAGGQGGQGGNGGQGGDGMKEQYLTDSNYILCPEDKYLDESYFKCITGGQGGSSGKGGTGGKGSIAGTGGPEGSVGLGGARGYAKQIPVKYILGIFPDFLDARTHTGKPGQEGKRMGTGTKGNLQTTETLLVNTNDSGKTEVKPNAILLTATHEYSAFVHSQLWTEAKAGAASNSGGGLVSIGSADEQRLIEMLMSASGASAYWIGLEWKQGNTYGWLDGAQFTILRSEGTAYDVDGDLVFTNWADGEPNNGGESGVSEPYGEIYANGQWNDNKATNRAPGYIAEKVRKTGSDTTNTIAENALFCGGVAGYNAGAAVLKACYNMGSVTIDRAYSAQSGIQAYAGGIAGVTEGTIRDSYNEGAIHAVAKSESSSCYADVYAQTIAYVSANGKIEDSAGCTDVTTKVSSTNQLTYEVNESNHSSMSGENKKVEMDTYWRNSCLEIREVKYFKYLIGDNFDNSSIVTHFSEGAANFTARFNFYQTGYTTVTLHCTSGDMVYTRILPVIVSYCTHEDALVQTVTEATCTENGFTVYTCKDCGYSYEGEFVAALGHSEEILPGKDATCTETGLTEGKKCSVCGEILVAQEEIAMIDHTWNEGVVTTEPTEEATGVKTFTCTACGETYTEELPKLEHVHKYEAVVTAPTCEEGGYTTYTCACGHSYVDDYVDALGHSEETIPGKAATCTETGLTEGKKCSACGEILLAQEVIAALGHSYETVITEPTCTEQGYTTYTCACGHSYVDDYVNALGHSEEILPGKDATCTETGLTEGKKCSVCGEILVAQEVIPATGHSYETVVTAPTCTEQGYTTYTCACGDSYVGDYVDALGHDYESVVTEPTYTAQGYTTHTCINCGDSYVDNYTAPLVPETDVKVTVGTVSGNAGDTVEVYLTLEKAPALKILAISQIVYDTEHLTFVSGQWLRDDSFTDTFSKKNMNGLQLFEENTDVNGEIFKLTFTINEDAPAGEYAVSCVITAKQTDENGDDLDVLIAMESGKIVVKDYLLGDVDGNEKITTDDAIYLLYNIMFGDGDYPVNQKCDFDGNGKVNTDDAIYLLYYIMFGETDYPLHG